MKFKAKKIDWNCADKGKWAVFAGSKFWNHTVGVEEFAKQQAAILSMKWHRDQMDIAWKVLLKESKLTRLDGCEAVLVDNKGAPEFGEKHSVTMGDCVC